MSATPLFPLEMRLVLPREGEYPALTKRGRSIENKEYSK